MMTPVRGNCKVSCVSGKGMEKDQEGEDGGWVQFWSLCIRSLASGLTYYYGIKEPLSIGMSFSEVRFMSNYFLCAAQT